MTFRNVIAWSDKTDFIPPYPLLQSQNQHAQAPGKKLCWSYIFLSKVAIIHPHPKKPSPVFSFFHSCSSLFWHLCGCTEWHKNLPFHRKSRKMTRRLVLPSRLQAAQSWLGGTSCPQWHPSRERGTGVCAPTGDMGQTGATYTHTLSWAKDPGGKKPGVLSNTTAPQKHCFLRKSGVPAWHKGGVTSSQGIPRQITPQPAHTHQVCGTQGAGTGTCCPSQAHLL